MRSPGARDVTRSAGCRERRPDGNLAGRAPEDAHARGRKGGVSASLGRVPAAPSVCNPAARRTPGGPDEPLGLQVTALSPSLRRYLPEHTHTSTHSHLCLSLSSLFIFASPLQDIFCLSFNFETGFNNAARTVLQFTDIRQPPPQEFYAWHYSSKLFSSPLIQM